MFGLGLSEILFLSVLALVVIGPKQLPEAARTLGRFLNELRRTTSVLTDDLKSHMKFEPIDLDPQPHRPAHEVSHEEVHPIVEHEDPEKKDPS